jgi:prepilin-type processing-associated H-X9-DG protein
MRNKKLEQPAGDLAPESVNPKPESFSTRLTGKFAEAMGVEKFRGRPDLAIFSPEPGTVVERVTPCAAFALGRSAAVSAHGGASRSPRGEPHTLRPVGDDTAALRNFRRRFTGARGFTRLDILAILAVLGLLSLLILPALAKPGLNSKSFQCLSNHRQMCNAWRMYADDNGDRIVYASTSGTSARSGASVPINPATPNNPDNFAWTGAHMTFNGFDRGIWDISYDIVKRPLWPYTKRDASIYKCPSDQSSVLAFGVIRPRLQSLSMNLYLGGFTGTDGGWPFAHPYRIFFKTTELSAPGPSKTFVFTDGRPDDSLYGNFMTDMTGYSPSNSASFSFADLPGFLHDGGAGLSFADGHTEIHRWTDPRTTPPLSPNGTPPSGSPSPGNPDIAWLQDHSTRLK